MSRPQWPDSHQRLSDKPGAIHTCTATLDRVTIRFGHSRLGTLLGTHGAFSLGPFRKRKENETRRRFS